MPITAFDGLLIAIMLVSAILAMVRGFVREVLSILSWVVAAVAAYKLYGAILPYIQPYISNAFASIAVSIGILFLVTLFIVSYITMRLSDFILESRIGRLDRTIGFIFGAARGFLLVVVALIFFELFVPEDQQPNWIAESKSRPILAFVGQQLEGLLPNGHESPFSGNSQLESNEGDATNSASQNQDDEDGYSETERDGLSQLTTSSDN